MIRPLKMLMALALAFALGEFPAPADTVDDLMAKGDVLDHQMKSKEALAVFEEADKERPNDPIILCRISKQYGDMMVDQKSKADKKEIGQKGLDYAQRALGIAPDSSAANLSVALMLGKLALMKGNKEKIADSRQIKAYGEKAVKLDPTSDYAEHLLGRWHMEMSDIKGLKAQIANILYGKLPESSYEDALAHMDRARQLRPDRLLHQVEYGRILGRLGRKEEAKRAIEKGLAMPSTEKDDEETKARGRETLKELG